MNKQAPLPILGILLLVNAPSTAHAQQLTAGDAIRVRPPESTEPGPQWTDAMIGSSHTAEAQTASEQTVESRKSPWAAFGLSVLIPGAGQAYNGQWGKGGLMLGGEVASVVVVAANIGDCGIGTFFGNTDGCGLVTVGLIGMAGFALWSWIDAPLAANAINRRIDAGQVALEIGPQLVALNRDSRIGLSLVRVRF